MHTDEIRKRYLEFFKRKGHTVVRSAGLIPDNDPTLLFTPAGMNQFKDLFLGIGHKPYSRATSVQKCFRTGDIENVGKTPRHHSFFEMLGNFSFGDYFKREAIAWAWEFITQELKLDTSRIYVSVYQDDDEAYNLWHNEIKLPDWRITRMGEHDNFWPADAPSKGPNGPCGPCSEIFFDWQNKYPNNKGTRPDYEDLVEFWNLVFTQFNRQDGGKLDPLPQKNIDTGMGLERIAAVMQGKQSNFQIDIFEAILAELSRVLGVPYKYASMAEFENIELQRMRRIADHIRAVVFAVGDGARPSNEGAGYVVRKILRNALKDVRAFEIDKPVLHRVTPVIAEVMRAYPELKENAQNIEMFIRNEERQYHETVVKAAAKFEELRVQPRYVVVYDPNHHRKSGSNDPGYSMLGSALFTLYDTYGLPTSEIYDLASQHNLGIDEAGFNAEMEAQRKRAQAGSKFKGDVFDTGYIATVKAECPPTLFVGYDTMQAEAKILALVKNEQIIQSVNAGDDVIVVLGRTPFYAESGGQVGDKGEIKAGGNAIDIRDCKKNADYSLHFGKVKSGGFKTGDVVTAQVNDALRLATRKNHTATHLLHARLKQVLGAHVTQAGSLVCADYLRFDFTHPQQVGKDELRKIERLVNEDIQTHKDVNCYETELEKAKAQGVTALFGEKYGDVVRVIDVPGLSKELCGGTHIDNVGKISLFKITAEGAIASGVRRIEAVTGDKAVAAALDSAHLLQDLARHVQVGEKELQSKYDALAEENKKIGRELARLQTEKVLSAAADMKPRASVNGLALYVEKFPADTEGLKTVAAQLAKKGASVSVFAGDNNMILLAATDEAVAAKKDARAAQEALKSVLAIKGGGRPQMVQGKYEGNWNADAIAAALQKAFGG